MRTPTEDHLHEIIKGKDTIIVSQAREIVALEEKMKEGRDVILTGLKIIEEMLELGID